MVALFAIGSLWFSGLKFKKGLVGVLTNFIVSFGALQMLSFWPHAKAQGQSFVKSMWMEHGTNNHSTYMQNFILAVCWGLLSTTIAFILPPFHTARNMLSKQMVPGALKDIMAHLHYAFQDGHKAGNVNGDDDNPDTEYMRSDCNDSFIWPIHLEVVMVLEFLLPLSHD